MAGSATGCRRSKERKEFSFSLLARVGHRRADSTGSGKPITCVNFQEPSGYRLITRNTLPRPGLLVAESL